MSVHRAVGLMSGTSMDGIDAALLETDGEHIVRAGAFRLEPYPPELRSALLRLRPDDREWASLEREVTNLQSRVVRALCAGADLAPSSIDCVGFHGQTIRHDPRQRRTHQLGDGQRMANDLGCVVIDRFRDADLAAGGQGAPLVPAYHRAIVRASGIEEPVAVLNIGGVANLTLVDGDDLEAWDCGPGNALIDDWMQRHRSIAFDADGRTAAAGRIDEPTLRRLLADPFFTAPGPKSLDRNAFSTDAVARLDVEDGAATLTAFTVEAIALSATTLSRAPRSWIVVGGGRRNPTLMRALRERLCGTPVRSAEDVGWQGDVLEAQAFAYLAVRSMRGLPLTWPKTTGVPAPQPGGRPHYPTRAPS